MRILDIPPLCISGLPYCGLSGERVLWRWRSTTRCIFFRIVVYAGCPSIRLSSGHRNLASLLSFLSDTLFYSPDTSVALRGTTYSVAALISLFCQDYQRTRVWRSLFDFVGSFLVRWLVLCTMAV
jgi:hypothetical protein